MEAGGSVGAARGYRTENAAAKGVRMAGAEDNGLVKLVEGFLAEKEAMAAREKKMIEDLNAVLGKLGYRVVAANGSSGSASETGKKRAGLRAPARRKTQRLRRRLEGASKVGSFVRRRRNRDTFVTIKRQELL